MHVEGLLSAGLHLVTLLSSEQCSGFERFRLQHGKMWSGTPLAEMVESGPLSYHTNSNKQLAKYTCLPGVLTVLVFPVLQPANWEALERVTSACRENGVVHAC